MVMEIALCSYENNGIDICSDKSLFDLQYIDNTVLLEDSISMPGMRFAPSKCGMVLQDLTGSKRKIVLVEEQLDEVDRFSYLGDCTSPGGSTSEEVSSRI